MSEKNGAEGWRFRDAAELQAMTAEEWQLLNPRVEAAVAGRRQRQVLDPSQKQVASRIKTSRPRIVVVPIASYSTMGVKEGRPR